jgi:hypothetical protein
MRLIGIVLLFSVILGCSSSKPAPKPFTWDSEKPTTQKTADNATKQDPCSLENLKTASDEQKRNCDPTTRIADSVSPKRTPPTTKKASP